MSYQDRLGLKNVELVSGDFLWLLEIRNKMLAAAIVAKSVKHPESRPLKKEVPLI